MIGAHRHGFNVFSSERMKVLAFFQTWVLMKYIITMCHNIIRHMVGPSPKICHGKRLSWPGNGVAQS